MKAATNNNYDAAKQGMNRERWLSCVMDELRPHFKDAGFPLPKNIRVTCGFPSRRARSATQRAIGESWSTKCSSDNTYEVLISPVEADSVGTAAILAHELAHVAAGHDQGHRGKFVICIRNIGLDGPPRRTVAGPRFYEIMKPVIRMYGKYPHATLNVTPDMKVQSTRLVKVSCPHCGYIARVTRTWIDSVGAPICPTHKVVMSVSRTSMKMAKAGTHAAEEAAVIKHESRAS